MKMTTTIMMFSMMSKMIRLSTRVRLEHNIMSSITGSRHNCEQGQPKPQLGGGAQPTTTTKPQGGRGRAPPQAPPHRGAGGDTMGWGGGGEGGCGSPALYTHTLRIFSLLLVCLSICMYVRKYVYEHIYTHVYDSEVKTGKPTNPNKATKPKAGPPPAAPQPPASSGLGGFQQSGLGSTGVGVSSRVI